MNTPPRSVVLLLSLVMTLGCTVGCMSQARHSPAREAAYRAGEANPVAPGGPVARHALLEIHATWWLGVRSSQAAADLARRLGGFADDHGGWVQSTSLGESEGSSHVTLRVPPTTLPALRSTLARAADAGTLREQTTSTDVTDAMADLDARLRSARATETRLLALMDQRTGSLADVLAVERALGEQRTQIEQLATEQRNAQGRVDLATVDVWLEHGAAGSTATLGQRVAHAARDGWVAARNLAVGAVLLTLESGPSLVLIAVVLWLCWRGVRWIRRRTV